MVGGKVVLLRICSLDLCRILRRECSASVVNEHGGLIIRYLLNSGSAGVVVIATNDVRVGVLLICRNVQITDDGLFVITIKRETAPFGILYQIKKRFN